MYQRSYFGELQCFSFDIPRLCLCWQGEPDERIAKRLLLEEAARMEAGEEALVHRGLEELGPPAEDCHSIVVDTHRPEGTSALNCMPLYL